jgi:hypothetical protein
MTLGTYPAVTLAQARDQWRAAREDVQKGRDPALARKRDKPSKDFASVARDWIKRDRPRRQPRKERSQREIERIVDRELMPAWGHRSFADIEKRDILDLVGRHLRPWRPHHGAAGAGLCPSTIHVGYVSRHRGREPCCWTTQAWE